MNFGESIRNFFNPAKGYGVYSPENGIIARDLTRGQAIELAKRLPVPEKSIPKLPERSISEMLVR